MNNPIQWVEIPAEDLERAKNFYDKVFKLKFEFIDMPGSRMYMFGEMQATGSGGSIYEASDIKPGTNGTTVYFECEDVNETIALVEPAGGKILIPKSDIGEFGFFAHILDTEGNRIGLHSNQ